jgi:hypothetical protein
MENVSAKTPNTKLSGAIEHIDFMRRENLVVEKITDDSLRNARVPTPNSIR